MGSEDRMDQVYYIVWDDGKIYPVAGIECVDLAMSEDRLLFDSEDDAKKYWREQYEVD